jgi:alkanesulfonate monooxygenase SsuD/methylene tetrahydromethanopterin reductase-like flavin-dependent oxidoreductase (luciferase family)
MHSPGFIADTDEQAIEISFPLFKEQMDKVGASRGWQPMTRQHFINEVKGGSMYVGSPETVAQKIAKAMRAVDVERFDLVYGFGPMKASDRRHMIELYGQKVIPRVRELLAGK